MKQHNRTWEVTPRFETIRRLFGDEPCIAELWSDAKDDTETTTLSFNFHTTPAGQRLTLDVFSLYEAHIQYTCRNRISNPRLITSQAERLPQGHRDHTESSLQLVPLAPSVLF
ncbi:hypothetical protein AVEN_106952-1 [Araneus ventricosus]|uniref:Uncharacterized protein n=1 Tax=Araneus ventricosus TaxID=182803 RepID=A0A4Y2GGN1_ARAVE|nr:hypothetical protein AVEN_106952-1 [Araneus ventricosus]